MRFDWYDQGFLAPPTYAQASGRERLYRAWGGDPRRKWGNTDLPGVCFSFDRAQSRWHAEMLYSVMEYQNAVRYLTEFSVSKGVPLWIGKVHPGDSKSVYGKISGSQVYIERAFVPLISEISTTELADDLGEISVRAGRPPRLSS